MKAKKESNKDQEPLMVIKAGLKMDSYKLREHIQTALKDVEFDIVIPNIEVIARRKEITPEPEEEVNNQP